MTTFTRPTLPRRFVVVATTLLTTFTIVSCSDDPPSSSAVPSPVAGSPSGAAGGGSTDSVLPPLSEPGDTVTDIAGPTEVGISFVAPTGAEEFDEGPGKRAFEVDGGSVMIGVVRAYYKVGDDGLLESVEPAGDPATALAAIRSRPDLEMQAQGQADVAGESALVVAFRTKPSADPKDLWCFQDEIPCYKMPTELRAQQVVVPWGDQLLVVHSEWEKSAQPPAGIMSARDEILQSLERTA